MPSPEKDPKGKNATKVSYKVRPLPEISFQKQRGKLTYQVWTASSTRDIDSAKAYILGSFPSHQSGDGGEGDGDTVQLIEVPNHAKDWDRSLTPHVGVLTFIPGPLIRLN